MFLRIEFAFILQSFVAASLAPLPLAKSYADATLLAKLMIGKFAYHLPFYHQAKMFRSLGIDLPESTIAGWREGVANLLRPTYYRLLELILSASSPILGNISNYY